MNGDPMMSRSTLKQQARQAMVHNIRPCTAASATLVALQLAVLLFQMNSGGVLGYYLLDAADYTSSTGIWLAEGGFTAILRFDMAGMLFALPLSFRQITSFIIVSGLVFIVTTPLLMGVLEQYYAILQKKVRPFSAIFGWYLDLRLTIKAVGLGLVLSLVKWTTRIVGALPGLALFVWMTGHGDLGSAFVSIGTFLACLLSLAGVAAAYWVYTLVLPAQYLLACEPDTSVIHVLFSGMKVFQGQRWNYFLFRLSFLLWYISINATYGTMGLIVLPYTHLANLLYLQAVVSPSQAHDITPQ